MWFIRIWMLVAYERGRLAALCCIAASVGPRIECDPTWHAWILNYQLYGENTDGDRNYIPGDYICYTNITVINNCFWCWNSEDIPNYNKMFLLFDLRHYYNVNNSRYGNIKTENGTTSANWFNAKTGTKI